VVDTVIQEQLDEPVQFVVAESGPATTSRVFPHGSRVLVYARQIGLIESEGLSVIKAKLREAMRTVLP
jgi:galactose-1-phosphate uridylyltransferase